MQSAPMRLQSFASACRRSALIVPALVLAAFSSAAGQAYSGTFTVPTEAGVMTFVLVEEGGTSVSGSLSGNGQTYQASGVIGPDGVEGRLTGPGGLMFFEAERWEDELWVMLYSADDQGQPMYEDYAEIDFVLQDPSSSSASASPESLQKRSSGSAGSDEPKGSGGQTATGRQLAPGFTEDHPMVREWLAHLAGKKVTRIGSYSSGSAGGYAYQTEVFLCSDRSFAIRSESSISVDVGAASAGSASQGNGQGAWYVITNGQAVGLILEYYSGEAEEYRMEYVDGGTYANGERVYVTPAEVCR